jgi:excisionase family DNA binding protein
MSVKEMAGQLGISLPKAYELTHVEGFPVIHVGRKKIVLVDGFVKWLSDNAGNRVAEGRGQR